MKTHLKEHCTTSPTFFRCIYHLFLHHDKSTHVLKLLEGRRYGGTKSAFAFLKITVLYRNKIRSSKAGESYQLLIKLLFSPTLLQILFFTVSSDGTVVSSSQPSSVSLRLRDDVISGQDLC